MHKKRFIQIQPKSRNEKYMVPMHKITLSTRERMNLYASEEI